MAGQVEQAIVADISEVVVMDGVVDADELYDAAAIVDESTLRLLFRG